MNHHSLRLTPSNSPFFKNTTPRSPTKPRSDEAGLRLKKIVGTTTTNAHGFDYLPAHRQFSYCAGAAAVVATVDADLTVTQRFFRARPSSSTSGRDGSSVFPISPTPNEARSRALGHVRDHNIGGSPLGGSVRDWSDSPNGKTATAKDRVKAATAVALSPNGKWVAMGETGYKPRVLIFSNGSDTSETPICALTEHTFGVHALRFSPDSRYLASLGQINDGFLYLWSIDDRTGAASLHSSNKCTVMINDMAWVGRSLLTVGLRFVKVWRVNEECSTEHRNLDSPAASGTPRQRNDFGNSILSPKQRVLAGKNSLLGDLLECNFVKAIPFGGDKAVLCAESGEIAILDDIGKSQSLRTAASVPFSISTAQIDESSKLHVWGANSALQQFDLDELQGRTPLSAKHDRRQTLPPTKSALAQAPTVIAVAVIDGFAVEMDTRRNIILRKLAENPPDLDQVETRQLTAHNDAVLGVRHITSDAFPAALLLTFSGNGVIRLWDREGASVSSDLRIPIETPPYMYDQINELRAAAAMTNRDGQYVAAGDRHGTLTMLDLRDGTVCAQVRAHISEIADVVAFERQGVQLIATCSRDRTVQLFTWKGGQADLLQTLDEHAAAVNGLLPICNGEVLLSYSQDRTVVVREALLRREDDPSSVAFAMTRVITLKSSPTSICPTAEDGEILVSSLDRCVSQYNIRTGQAGFSFKCSDSEGGEAVAMSKIAYEPCLNGNPAIVGISSVDKSVRLYSEYGLLIARDWGHTEGITDLAVLRSGTDAENTGSEAPRVVTVAADSTIFVWDTSLSSRKPQVTLSEANATAETPSMPLRPPLRKVLSFSDLPRPRRENSIEESGNSPLSSQRQRSPHRLKKRPSKVSVTQAAPKLEPAFRSSYAENPRRRSLRKRSPSPPSPRTKKDVPVSRKPSLGMTLRSKSSENVLSGGTSPTATNTGFGSLTASTESACRTLRAYRKKVSNPSALDAVPSDMLRNLEMELKMTAEAIGTDLPSKQADGEAMAKVLEEASEKLASRLDERIKERVEDEMRRSAEASPAITPAHTATSGSKGQGHDVEAVAGAFERVALDER